MHDKKVKEMFVSNEERKQLIEELRLISKDGKFNGLDGLEGANELLDHIFSKYNGVKNYISFYVNENKRSTDILNNLNDFLKDKSIPTTMKTDFIKKAMAALTESLSAILPNAKL